jgi:glycine cleavage system H lipoate-binding protein/ABC-type phosphate transport system substrate-binding protein
MKKLIVFLGLTALIAVRPSMGQSTDNSLQIWTSPGLEEFAENVISGYKTFKPGVEIKAISGNDSGIDELLDKPGSIGIIDKKAYSDFRNREVWKLTVGRDVFVPVMNIENPYREDLFKKGISQDDLKNLLKKPGSKVWGDLLGNEMQAGISLCICQENSLQPYLTDFTDQANPEMSKMEVSGIENFLTKIRRDKYAIGFCKLSNVIDNESGDLKKGLSFLPIDQNGNGKLDYFENIYQDSEDFTRGVWIGKYPNELYSEIYAVTNYSPESQNLKEFIEWLITKGQSTIAQSGYTELVLSELHSKLERLRPENQLLTEIQDETKEANLGLILLIISLSVLLFAYIVFHFFRTENEVNENKVPDKKYFNEDSIDIPGGLFFDKSHTWAFMEKQGYVKSGIDEFLQSVTGNISRVIMKSPGEKIRKGETFLTIIQQGKQLEIKSPLTGTILENNSTLLENAGVLNSSPYDKGWVYKIEVPDWGKETKVFYMGDKYKEWLSLEFKRLKDFLSNLLNTEGQLAGRAVMQDGGELMVGILESQESRIWEEFQIGFLNYSK